MYNQEATWGLSPFEILLATLFSLIVFVAYRQDMGKMPMPQQQQSEMASFFPNNNSEAIRQNKTQNNAMNKVDSLFHYLEERSGGEISVLPPALTTDEKRFFHQIAQQAKLRKQSHDFSEHEMKSVIKAAAVTYEHVEKVAISLGIDGFATMDWSAAGAMPFFKKLEEDFGISAGACQRFGHQKPTSVGDWAFFLESQMQ